MSESSSNGLKTHTRLVLAICLSLLVGVKLVGDTVWQMSLSENYRDTTTTLYKRGATSSSRFQPCPSAVEYFNHSDLTAAINNAVDFHFRGGNLLSVSKFKDSTIDETLKKLNLEFVPNDEPNKHTSEFTSYLRKFYKDHYDPRNGYGRPLPGKFTNEKHPALMGNRWFDVVEDTRGRLKWDASLGPIGPNCTNLIEVGPRNDPDGSKFYCAGESLFNATQDECHIISIGGNDNWKFEAGVRQQLGCVTHTFDCTLAGGKPRRRPQDDKVRFYNYCIDGRSYNDSHGRQYLTYTDMLKTARLVHKAPVMFKLDVEGYEFDVFVQMVRDTPPELLPQQIAVELHWGTRMTGLSWMPRLKTSGEIALLVNTMLASGGYLPIHLGFTPYCTPCMEVLFFRAVC